MSHLKCIMPLDGLLTKDRVYDVIYENKQHAFVVDDRGIQAPYYQSRFEPVAIYEMPTTGDEKEQQALDRVETAKAINEALEHFKIPPIHETLVVEKYNTICPVIEKAETIMQAYETSQIDTSAQTPIIDRLLERRSTALERMDIDLVELLTEAISRIKELEAFLHDPGDGE